MSASRLTTHPRARRAARPLAAAAGLLTLVLALAACGSSSGSTATSATGAGNGQRPGGGLRFARNPKVQACLKKQGVTLPTFGGRGRRGGGPGGPGGPGAGAGGTGTTTTPRGIPPQTTTNGAAPPANGRSFGRPGQDPAQLAKMQAALKKCGVQFPNGGRFRGGPPNGGAPNGGAPNGGQTSTTPATTTPS